VIWGASWSNTDYELLSYVLSKTSGPVYVQVGNLAEIPKLERFHPRIRCLKQMLAEWIRPENYQPKPVAERSRDILMLANWAPFKRHWHFFEVLSRMPADLKVTLIGQEESGRTRDNIRREARLFNVPQVLEIEQSIPPEQVAEIQCDSKVSAIFSRREGQCIALAESLCAGATIATLRDAHIGSTAYINEQTGQFLDRGREHRQLLDMVRNAEKFDPRGWALKHIAADISTPLLNNVFQEFEQQAGRPWTHDLLEFCMHPYPTLRHHPQREQMRPTIQALHQRYPQAFPADLLESSQS
jgi:glycosyltransferase involved in cell wall biosynthesis